jgi:hypothetical protein
MGERGKLAVGAVAHIKSTVAVARLARAVNDIRRRRILDRLVEPDLRSRVGPGTLGFASREPVDAVLADGTLVLYDGGLIRPAEFHVVELQPRGGYRIWERLAKRA